MSLQGQSSIWKSEFVICIDPDSEELRIEIIYEVLVVVEELGVDSRMFVEASGRLPVKTCHMQAPTD